MSKRFVVDASVTLSWCFADEGGEECVQVLEALSTGEVVVPSIWWLEVTNVLVTAERRGRLKRDIADQFLSLLEKLPITVDPYITTGTSHRILMYAREYNLSSYNASYLELAVREGLPLATQDQALLNAMQQAGVLSFW